MALHKQILDWQAAHPNTTWAVWCAIWIGVLAVLFWPLC